MAKHQISFYDEHGIEQTWMVEPREGETLIQALNRTRSLYAINQKTEIKPDLETEESKQYFWFFVAGLLVAIWAVVAWFLEN
jgi:hypothetical protein